MRVLMLPRYDSQGASSRLRMLQYVPSLQADGIDVDVSPLLDDGYVGDLYAGKISVLKVVRAYYRRFRVLLLAGRYDVLWIEKELFPWLPSWLELRLLPGRVAVVVDYDDAVFHRYDQHRSRIVRAVLGNKISAVMRIADVVTAGNDYLSRHAAGAGAKSVKWLPTVVDLERYDFGEIESRPEVLTIGWIGSPSTASYLHPLTHVLREVGLQCSIKCVAIGARPDQVQGTPFQAVPWSESREVEMLKGFDIGIMPLPDEPWERGKCGYKLIQYMACGVPVIASAVGVNVDIVQSGENGELASTQEEWKSALMGLVSDSQLRRRMGQAGRRRVETIYSLQAQASRLIGMLRTASSRNGG